MPFKFIFSLAGLMLVMYSIDSGTDCRSLWCCRPTLTAEKQPSLYSYVFDLRGFSQPPRKYLGKNCGERVHTFCFRLSPKCFAILTIFLAYLCYFTYCKQSGDDINDLACEMTLQIEVYPRTPGGLRSFLSTWRKQKTLKSCTLTSTRVRTHAHTYLPLFYYF